MKCVKWKIDPCKAALHQKRKEKMNLTTEEEAFFFLAEECVLQSKNLLEKARQLKVKSFIEADIRHLLKYLDTIIENAMKEVGVRHLKKTLEHKNQSPGGFDVKD